MRGHIDNPSGEEMRHIAKHVKYAAVLFSSLTSTPLFACSDCEYEQCAFTACVCLPKDKCVVPQIIKDAGQVVEQAPRLVVTTFEKGVEDVGATVAKAFNDTIITTQKAASDVGTNLGKAGEDTKAEAGRFGRELGTTGQALVDAARSDLTGTVDAIRQADERVRAGKVIDAVWHASLAPIQVADKSASEAVLESSYLRGIGQVAATVYGGPGGAAAYAAWLTYKQTGDPSLALRVGILTGATAAAFAGAKAIDDETKRIIVTAAVGGGSVAAAGGNADAVTKAFLQAGAMVAIQDGFKAYTKQELSGQSSVGKAYCITATAQNCVPLPPNAIVGTDANGNFEVDMSQVDPGVPAVGLKDYRALFNETNPVMTAVSRVPGMQGMAIFHDTWTERWQMDALATPVSILPAIVLTYVGLGAPYYETLQGTAVEGNLGIGPSVPVSDKAPAINRFAVVDSAVRINDGVYDRQYILERWRGEKWCTGKDEVRIAQKPIKVPGGTSVIELYPRCLTKSLKEKRLSERDFACRLLKEDKGAVTVVTNSLDDSEACEPAFRKTLLKEVESPEGNWYRSMASPNDGAQIMSAQ